MNRKKTKKVFVCLKYNCHANIRMIYFMFSFICFVATYCFQILCTVINVDPEHPSSVVLLDIFLAQYWFLNAEIGPGGRLKLLILVYCAFAGPNW